MKAFIAVNSAPHQVEAADRLSESLKRHGINCQTGSPGEAAPCDFLAVWGYRFRNLIERARSKGIPVLVMEAGHLQPRAEWTSLGWNGLAGRGLYPKAEDSGRRFWRHFADHYQPWKDPGDYALVLGQVPNDHALAGQDARAWAQQATDRLIERGWRVRYRPHPKCLEADDRWCPKGAHFLPQSLAFDLARADVAVTFSSTAGVEAALDGVPVIACDEGAMCRPVAAHSLDDNPRCPNRMDWCADMAWTQWTDTEIRTGEAWEAVKTCGVLGTA